MLPLRKNLQRLFDPERKIYARDQLRVGDYIYDVRQEVPWQELGIAVEDVMVWFRNRLVSHFEDGDQSPEAMEAYHPGREFPRETQVPAEESTAEPAEAVEKDNVEEAPETSLEETPEVALEESSEADDSVVVEEDNVEETPVVDTALEKETKKRSRRNR